MPAAGGRLVFSLSRSAKLVPLHNKTVPVPGIRFV